MLEKSMYDSWASRIRLFIKGKKHGWMMLDSIDNAPLVYPTIEENRQTRPKKYSELTEAQQLQDDCDVQAMNIILHGLPPDVFALVNHQEAAKDIWDRVKMLMKGKYPIDCINKAMAFLSAVASRFPPSNNQLRISSNPRNQATIQDGRVTTDDVDAYDSDCDELSPAKAVLMENLSSCDPEVLSELKERIKSLCGKDSVENVKKDIDEIKTINIELEHSMAKLLLKNENLRKEREYLKSIYKDQFDSIRKTRVQSKEHFDSLIAQINSKFVENSNLNAKLQERVFAITALTNELRKLKGKNVVNTVVSKHNATLSPGMLKLDIKSISPRLKNLKGKMLSILLIPMTRS
ncbi:hypothetical protein Tco_0015650 [Tanacetum coccineum]